MFINCDRLRLAFQDDVTLLSLFYMNEARAVNGVDSSNVAMNSLSGSYALLTTVQD
ncbi:hypothetical protein BWQ96_03252 [Gracilariopsis chorda]|uniref:Uncharacterized protein n=1 Tax=Gracilariopsis chorda TaxID=448386 RepID=A0A2V3IXM6_9FLOR|nr:hypothetical protein BWQ96_03252 [Gracilariopsis chorda]|eukprot:PXF46914.1 hypothetical protein BWQ96_03252 [Gracilariopsis chorda]